MARKTHTFEHTTTELDNILNRADIQPFVRYHDEAAGVYRFFPTEEKMLAWVKARTDDEMTPEIAAYEFTEPITAPAPYTININMEEPNKYILEGTKGVTLDFTFETRDGNESIIQEPVDVYYTFTSASSEKKAFGAYNFGEEVHLNIDNYLGFGTNSINIIIKGRFTGISKTFVAVYKIVRLSLTSSFNIAYPIEQNSSINIPYSIVGDEDKTVYFYIDGTTTVYNTVVTKLEPQASKIQVINSLAPGKHTLQMFATMQVGQKTFKSNLLYFEFIVKGSNITTVLISETFPSTTEIIDNTTPTLIGEQYVVKSINWAYYSSDYNKRHATIVWKLHNSGGSEIPIATRNADVVEVETDVIPEPLRFMPTDSGMFLLQPYIDDVLLDNSEYPIAISVNTTGIIETTDNITMKLSGLGRDNTEPVETLSSWENRGFSTIFTNQPWNARSGWNNNALWLNDGATAIINNKPFAEENAVTVNGSTFEIDFETFNVNREDSVVLQIGALGTASLTITANKATLKNSNNKIIEARFKQDERVKIAFVIHSVSDIQYPNMVFLYYNGTMSGVLEYDGDNDNFNIGSYVDSSSDVGKIKLGNASEDLGIKIYSIRTYNRAISMYEELNNYFIDSGDNIQYLVDDNNIYSQGTKIIDVNKITTAITTVKFTGPLNTIIGRGKKDDKLSCILEITSPENPNINMHCDAAQVYKAGQSTLDKPVPSFHVKLDKNGNQCYDKDNNPLPKNRWAFREGNVPEKKFRLQANYMDSSCCHNGAFFRLYNEVAPNVRINNEYVLRIPSIAYSLEQYPAVMQSEHGYDPSGNNWKFPYTLNTVPDSIPCVVIWRPTESDDYQFLGQYLIMEEKKANYANGMHSIYSGVDKDGYADPFGFKSSKSGNVLWDNKDCHQMEILSSAETLPLFLDDSDWNTIIIDERGDEIKVRESYFELIYPDEDDLTTQEIEAEWTKFYNDVVHAIVSTKNNQAAFNNLLYGSNPKLDRWAFAAYYCLVLRNACSDSFVRNMELVTYDGKVWGPKWWDVDMQCGLEQSGYLNVNPKSDRSTKLSADTWAFSGRIGNENTTAYKSSWLLDALEGSTQFMQDVRTMDTALYEAGWKYSKMTEIQDKEYVDAWSNALYNESSIIKYLKYDKLNYKSLQGDRTPHRHWFLRTSYDYFDALHACGEYRTKQFQVRTEIAKEVGDPDPKVYITPSETSYFGWEHTDVIAESGVLIEKGDTGYLTINMNLHYQDPLHILGANKIEELDMSELSTYLYADIKCELLYDEVLGTNLKKLILGSGDDSYKTRLNNGYFNTHLGATVIGGLNLMNRLEYLDIQGMQSLGNPSVPNSYFDLSGCSSLKELYAAGSCIGTFKPANGSRLTKVELPTTITTIDATSCNFTDANNHCVIKWYNTLYDSNNYPTGVELTTVPSTIKTIRLTSMNEDLGAQELITDWLDAVYTDYGDAGLRNVKLYYTNDINWVGISKSTLLKIAKIPSYNRTLIGYIKVSGTLTGEDLVTIKQAFGNNVFTMDSGVPLHIDADGGFILAAPSTIDAGGQITLSGVSFPIATGGSPVSYILGYYDENDNFVARTRQQDLQGNYYYLYTKTVNGQSVRLVTLYESTGLLITEETDENDFDIVIKAVSGSASDFATISVLKHTYPTSLDINVTKPQGKKVSEDTTTHIWYVNDNDLTLIFNAETDNPQATGTIVSETWEISNSILALLDNKQETNNALSFHIENSGSTLTSGTISHIKVYGSGLTLTKTLNFRFKSPVLAVTQNSNPPLQSLLYSEGISESNIETFDTELWHVPDLSFLSGSENTLYHFAEFNSFSNLNIANLDLTDYINLGNLQQEQLLEDGTYQDVTIFPRADQSLILDFENINLRNTHLKGINLKEGNVLESITYGNFTEEVKLVNQTSLAKVNIPYNTMLNKFIIEGCSNLEEIIYVKYNKKLEYIQSTGTQFIITPVCVDSNCKITLVFSADTSESWDTMFFIPGQGGYNSKTLKLAGNTALFLANGSSYTTQQIQKPSGINTMLYNNGVLSVGNVSQNGNFASNDNLPQLFTNVNTMKLYSYKVEKNNKTICNLIPVKDLNNIACLYDTVSDTILHNQGTGDFIAGPEI